MQQIDASDKNVNSIVNEYRMHTNDTRIFARKQIAQHLMQCSIQSLLNCELPTFAHLIFGETNIENGYVKEHDKRDKQN